MRLTLLSLVLSLALIGCGGDRTRLNPGADLAWYEGSTAWMFEHMPPGMSKADHILYGLYDPTDGSITTHEQLRGYGPAIAFSHELVIHAWDHQKPKDGVELLRRYSSPACNFGFHSDEDRARGIDYLTGFPDPLAVRRALDAAHQAQQEAKP